MKLFQPEIIKKEVNDEHYYFINGTYVPSVTKILGETMPMPYALRYWIGEVGNERAQAKLEQAGDRGTAIHSACERLLNSEEISLIEEFKDNKDKKVLVGFVNWCAQYQPEVLATEKTVASRYGYAGTLDLYCKIAGANYIIDFKTSSAIHDSHKLQLVGYQNAVYEMTGDMAKMGILHLNSKVKAGYTFITDMKIAKKDVEIADFVKVFEVYKMLNGGTIPQPPLIDNYPETLKLKKI